MTSKQFICRFLQGSINYGPVFRRLEITNVLRCLYKGTKVFPVASRKVTSIVDRLPVPFTCVQCTSVLHLEPLWKYLTFAGFFINDELANQGYLFTFSACCLYLSCHWKKLLRFSALQNGEIAFSGRYRTPCRFCWVLSLVSNKEKRNNAVIFYPRAERHAWMRSSTNVALNQFSRTIWFLLVKDYKQHSFKLGIFQKLQKQELLWW